MAVLTTGFDAPHVDLIAILRPTESVSLYQQIVGRGLRLCDGKQDCLILDYAGNPHDLYTPEVGSRKPHGDSQPVQVFCPPVVLPIPSGASVTGRAVSSSTTGGAAGYFEDDEGRREQCDYRFRFKTARSAMRKTISPPAAAISAPRCWSTLTIC